MKLLPPGKEAADDPGLPAIAEAVRDLVAKRDARLNPEDASEKEFRKRTLTNLHSHRPTWIDLAHKRLDEAVLDAYDWPHDLSVEDFLERFMTLNLEREGGRHRQHDPSTAVHLLLAGAAAQKCGTTDMTPSRCSQTTDG